MPYVILDGMKLYMDYRTGWEDKNLEYQKKYNEQRRLIRNGIIKKKKEKKEKVNKLDEPYICVCGGKYTLKTSKSNHIRSKKHIKYYKNIEFQNNLSTKCLSIDVNNE